MAVVVGWNLRVEPMNLNLAIGKMQQQFPFSGREGQGEGELYSDFGSIGEDPLFALAESAEQMGRGPG